MEQIKTSMDTQEKPTTPKVRVRRKRKHYIDYYTNTDQDKFSKDWKFLSLHQKQDLLYNWYVDGGALSSVRYRKSDLCNLLELDPKVFDKILNSIKSKMHSAFDDPAQIKKSLYSLVTRSLAQLESDRARLVTVTNKLDVQLDKFYEELKEVEKLPAKTAPEIRSKTYLKNSVCRNIINFSEQKISSLKVLFEGTDRHLNFLALFNGGKKTLTLDPSASSENLEDSIDHKKAIQLLEEKLNPILPKQDLRKTGTRNPHAGFEEFENSTVL